MTSEDTQSTSVLVTGDVVRDHYLYEGDQYRRGSTIRLGTRQKSHLGGAALLFDLLRELAAAKNEQGAIQWPASVSFGLRRDRLEEQGGATKLANGYCLMKPFAETKQAEKKVWRIAQPLGFDGDVEPLPNDCLASEILARRHDVVVIDDAGIQFRRWPSRAAWPRCLLNVEEPLLNWLVLKLSSPVAAGDLWHTLTSGQTQDFVPTATGNTCELGRRTIAIVAINDLRVEAIHVAKSLSWERTTLDFVRELRQSVQLAAFRSIRFLIVTFGIDGALLVEFLADAEQGPIFRLVFDPSKLEGDSCESIPGTMIGFQTCLTAAVVANLPQPNATDDATRSALEQGLIAGLKGMRRLQLAGHGPAPVNASVGFPFNAVCEEILADKHDGSFGKATVPTKPATNDAWTIVAGNPVGGVVPLWGLARRVARGGVRELQQTPYLEFGKLFSVERSEIESLRTIRRLLLDYQRDERADKPLSIAAFGPPGAGKSFGVKQLAKAVFDDVPLLEFNLSQFDQPSELHGLLHQVRDKVLEGKLPIVFWDEFDTRGLFWLQFLLAPMQDGKFQEGQITHPLGKCVFVFAGGTCSSYEDFGTPPDDPTKLTDEKKKFAESFVALKGPDFKSRLAGYINVLGPNRREHQTNAAVDITFPVRRALLLRVHLGIGAKEPLTIDPGLLTAFLHVERYNHGARSLEKIAEQLRYSSRNGEFQRSDLPPRSQLNLHVDAAKFLELLERDL